MAKPIHLFVSSSPDLAEEREIVGQVVARMGLNIGWRIGHTPRAGAEAGERALWVEECDIYVILLSQDFAAPMGEELMKALNKEVKLLAYHKLRTPSPSTLNTLHHIPLKWQHFGSSEQFRWLFTRDLLKTLIDQAEKLELNLADLAGMLHLIDPPQRPPLVTAPTGDAGQGGVILGREATKNE
ncbi:MAG: hypothetical protein JW934_12680 [Anaerolineae bacterium]|nr:hypothetical protein [Anaerolineae bacterium]